MLCGFSFLNVSFCCISPMLAWIAPHQLWNVVSSASKLIYLLKKSCLQQWKQHQCWLRAARYGQNLCQDKIKRIYSIFGGIWDACSRAQMLLSPATYSEWQVQTKDWKFLHETGNCIAWHLWACAQLQLKPWDLTDGCMYGNKPITNSASAQASKWQITLHTATELEISYGIMRLYLSPLFFNWH